MPKFVTESTLTTQTGHNWALVQVISKQTAGLEQTDLANVFALCEAGQSNETLRFKVDAEGDVIRLWERNEYSGKDG